MDLISRLKNFMDLMQIPVTKFADNCSIPRPSMTQLLKGRNKKVSDEVIAKIHHAYPMLNISWLLFGEGDMMNDPNFQFSKPLNPRETQVSDNLFPDFESETFERAQVEAQPDFQPENIELASQPFSTPTPIRNILPASNPHSRRVVNIMVFYSDNSFETFVPQ